MQRMYRQLRELSHRYDLQQRWVRSRVLPQLWRMRRLYGQLRGLRSSSHMHLLR